MRPILFRGLRLFSLAAARWFRPSSENSFARQRSRFRRFSRWPVQRRPAVWLLRRCCHDWRGIVWAFAGNRLLRAAAFRARRRVGLLGRTTSAECGARPREHRSLRGIRALAAARDRVRQGGSPVPRSILTEGQKKKKKQKKKNSRARLRTSPLTDQSFRRNPPIYAFSSSSNPGGLYFPQMARV